MSNEETSKRKRRDSTRLDTVERIRQLLGDYTSQAGRSRFVICIDELDKLPNVELS